MAERERTDLSGRTGGFAFDPVQDIRAAAPVESNLSIVARDAFLGRSNAWN